MRHRLFWKILIGFWLTFMAIIVGVWVVAMLYGPQHRPPEFERAERLSRTLLNSAAAAVERGGLPALVELLASWPEEERHHLSVSPADAPEALPAGDEAGPGGPPWMGPQRLSTVAKDPESVLYRLRYGPGPRRGGPPPRGPFLVPWEVWAVGSVGGLLFSSLLAWHLTRPIRSLRFGFGQLAQGRLDVRLQPSMGRRSDEIADLARDFDLMAERLQQLLASRDQLLHDVSHELRSPLARLHMAIGLARQNPQRLQGTLDRIEQESVRLDEIVGELLTLSRVESGAPQLDEYFDLESLVQAVVADARFESQATGVRIETTLEEAGLLGRPSPTVKGNAELVRRALENVIRNAIHHSAAGQTVEVGFSLDWDGDSFLIQVDDQGPGVEPGMQEAMFDPFVRLGNGQTAVQGFGLGLAIAKRAVLAHGGDIAARNRDGGGLRVTIRLPFGPLGLDESRD